MRQEIINALTEMNITVPSPVQAEVIPLALQGRDVLAQAPTGTGKTFAFGIPIIDKIDIESRFIQAVIICPTRELVMQTERELKKLAKFLPGVRVLAIYGGQAFERQLNGLRKKPQIVVGTPGRMLDHLRRDSLRIKKSKILVLDEADEMLNMGFRDDIDAILNEMPEQMQTMLFSATMPREILEISKDYQYQPANIKTTINDSELPEIKQYSVKLQERSKMAAFRKIMALGDYKFTLVFCNTKARADRLNAELADNGYLADVLHGDLRQRQRDAVMKKYRERNINILVATDVAARGIDVDNIEAVINYDVPMNGEYYVHRIGRTARASRTGTSYTLASPKDIHRLKDCENSANSKMEELLLDGVTDNNLSNSRKGKNLQRLFLNVGTKDKITTDQLKKFLMKHSGLQEQDITDIKLLETFSFLEVDKIKSPALINLSGKSLGKRVLSIELADERHSAKPKQAPSGKKPLSKPKPVGKDSKNNKDNKPKAEYKGKQSKAKSDYKGKPDGKTQPKNAKNKNAKSNKSAKPEQKNKADLYKSQSSVFEDNYDYYDFLDKKHKKK